MEHKFATAMNCIDGRAQIPVINWLKEHFGVEYVDMITAPGMDRVLSHGPCAVIEWLKKSAVLSVTAHHSKVIAVVGHFDCAANPVTAFKHYQDIVISTNLVKSWRLHIPVIGLYVDEAWRVRLVD